MFSMVVDTDTGTRYRVVALKALGLLWEVRVQVVKTV